MFQDEFSNHENGANSLFSTIVGVAIRAFLAVTTAGFFYAYGGDIWSWILPYPMANYAAAITGVVLVDGLAFAWTFLRRSSADTEEQQHYAKLGAWLDMALSLTVTAVFIILTTPLLAASVSPEVLNVLLNLASWLGIIVGVVAFAGNGLTWHFFDNASASSVQQLRTNQLRAMALRAEHTLETERLKLHTGKALAQIREALPQFAQAAASKSKDDYLASRFAQIEQEPLPLPPSQPKREYTRADRPAMAASTRPAPASLQRGKVNPNTGAVTLDDGTIMTPDEVQQVREAAANFTNGHSRNGR